MGRFNKEMVFFFWLSVENDEAASGHSPRLYLGESLKTEPNQSGLDGVLVLTL